MWKPYVVAVCAAAAVTFLQLRVVSHRFPFRSAHAIFWWLATAALDAALAALLMLGTIHYERHVTGWFVWAAIGALGPLGLRSPVWRPVSVNLPSPTRKTLNVDPGITFVYDVGRAWFVWWVDEWMSALNRTYRRRVGLDLSAKKWDGPSFLGLVVQCIAGHVQAAPDQREAAEKAAFLAMTFSDESLVMDALIEVCISYRLVTALREASKRPPTDVDRQRGVDAARRADAFLEEVRQREKSHT